VKHVIVNQVFTWERVSNDTTHWKNSNSRMRVRHSRYNTHSYF